MKRKSPVGFWKNGELPPGMMTTAESRTEGMRRVFGLGSVTLTQFAQSCYLQGINDTMETLQSRFPYQVDAMFGGTVKPCPPFEVM